jgi:rubredoxin
MSRTENKATPVNWVCARCDGQVLEPGKVKVAYLGGEYNVDLFRCPRCGLVFIPEDLAVGQMAEAEQYLENK